MQNIQSNFGEQSNCTEMCTGICDSDSVIIKRYKLPREEKSCLDKQAVKKCLISLLTGLNHLNNESKDKLKMRHNNVTPDSTVITIGGEYLLGEVNLVRSLDYPVNKLEQIKELYTSPVLLNNDTNDDKSDIWSLGCVLYEMCTLNPPFSLEQIKYYAINNTAEVKLNSIPSCFSKELNDIIMKMLVVDPTKRISFSDLMDSAYIKEEINKYYEVSDLLKDFLIQTQSNEINNINNTQTIQGTVMTSMPKNVENFFQGLITTKTSVSIYDVLCNSTYYQWLLDLKIKRWFVPIKEKEDDEPSFFNDAEVTAFKMNHICMSRYIRIIDLLLHFYGYVSVVNGEEIAIESFMSDYEKRFRKWLVNVDEIHFFNRLLKSLKLIMPQFAETVKNRITMEAKSFAKDPNTINEILFGV